MGCPTLTIAGFALFSILCAIDPAFGCGCNRGHCAVREDGGYCCVCGEGYNCDKPRPKREPAVGESPVIGESDETVIMGESPVIIGESEGEADIIIEESPAIIGESEGEADIIIGESEGEAGIMKENSIILEGEVDILMGESSVSIDESEGEAGVIIDEDPVMIGESERVMEESLIMESEAGMRECYISCKP